MHLLWGTETWYNIAMNPELKTWLGSGSINLFGLPYAGKDTQGHLLAEEFEGQLLGGGEILRNSVITPAGKAAMVAGELFPTQEYINTVLPYLSKQEFAGKPLILSSVGRWHGEEDGVIQAAEQSGHPIKAVVYLNMSEPTLYERWEIAQSVGGRDERLDDDREKLAVRLAEFKEKTLPVIDYYRAKGLLIEVDANQHVISVTRDILDALVSRASEAQ